MDPEPFTMDIDCWVNSDPVEMNDLRGRIVVVEAFQMLCPGCVSNGIPQAKRVQSTYSRDDVVVLGLHTVFEHHEVMGPDALRAFVSEYRVTFPVAVDRPTPGRSIPMTMARYGLQGTPSTLIVDRAGRLRHVFFGAIDDMALGTRIGLLLAETWEPGAPAVPPPRDDAVTPTDAGRVKKEDER